MVVNLIAYWVIGIPTAYLLGFTYNYGAPGFWIGLIAGLTAAGILHNARFFIKTRH
jgi:MATE family multidrug resistance protein